MATLIEPLFGEDSFRKPKLLKDSEVMVNAILMVLFGKPGFFPSIPELGMYIQQYRYVNLDQVDTDQMKVQLAYQCGLLKDDIISGDIDIQKVMLGNGNIALGIKIPITENHVKSSVLIGVQYKEDGIAYNYDLIAADSENQNQ